MTVRVVTVIVCILDVVGWLLTAIAYFVSQSDQATAGFDDAVGMIITVLFAITVVPAFALVLTRKLPRTALTLALAFPAIFAILFVAVIIAFT